MGHLDEDGFLVITGRIKDLIITSTGKNVAPQLIETVVGKDHYIEQLAVIGDKRKHISALIVPAFESLADGGEVTMGLHDSFWGARFGMVVDRFGVSWMFSAPLAWEAVWPE